MSDMHTDLVIQISTSVPADDATGAGNGQAEESRLVTELRRCLQPGVEIALVLQGYVAITSVLWLSGPLPQQGLRAGVRLLGVSALPASEPLEPIASWHNVCRTTVLTPSDSAPIRQL